MCSSKNEKKKNPLALSKRNKTLNKETNLNPLFIQAEKKQGNISSPKIKCFTKTKATQSLRKVL